MPKLTGAQAIINSLLQYDIDTIFGLPGGQTYHLFDAIYAEQDNIKLINSRHEQGVAYMAYGYARSTGKIGVYTVVPGPGVLNTTAALCTAYGANEKVLCLAGQIPSAWIDKGVGFLHEIPDQLGIIRHLTKFAERIDHPAQAPGLVHEAIKNLYTGRPRPVALEMAPDIMGMESDVTFVDTGINREPAQADPDLIKQAADLLAGAQNPLIVYGGGAVEAGAELLEVATLLQAPATTLWSGKGIIDERNYLSVPFPVGHKFWSNADVVLAVGSRLKFPQMYWGLDEDIKIIRIDIDPGQLDLLSTPAVGLTGDAGAVLEQLYNQLQQKIEKRPSRESELTEMKQAMFRDFEQNIGPQMAILKVIRDELPEDGFFVDEVTQVGYASWYAFPAYHPRHFITSSYQGNLGYGYATAIGVQVAHPDKKVIVIGGDGGFMYQAQELATAVKYGLNIVCIIFNNQAYGNVRRDQTQQFNGRVIGSDLHNPDFVKFAESFGAMGIRVENPEQLRAAIKNGFKQDGPVLIEMPSHNMPSPWPYIMLPAAR